MTDRLTWLLIVRVPTSGVADYRRYEDIVLPLLAGYDGRLESRYASHDGGIEVHVVSFPSEADLEAYLADNTRQRAQHILSASHASSELVQVTRVG